MSITVAKKIGKYSIELHVVLLLVLCAFFSVLKLLNVFFPEGSSLKQLINQVDFFQPIDKYNDLNKNILVELNGETRELGAQSSIVAKIESIQNTVKSKPAGNIAWKRAVTGLSLFNRDALQTFSHSSAKIQFDEKNYLHLGENSLIIIKQFERDFMSSTRHARLILSTGFLHSVVSATQEGAMDMKVITGDISTSVTSTKLDSPVDFKVKLNPDKTSTITVIEGQAKVTMLGDSIRVITNQAVTLTSGETIPDPVTPTKKIHTIAPKYKGVFTYHEIPRPIKFIWQRADSADGYQLFIARDNKFRDIIVNERLKKSYFTHKNLKEGTYYWKVRGLIGWIEGVFSNVSIIRVLKDVKPPSLHVVMPPDVINKKYYEITGNTDRKIQILINSIPVFVSFDGKFKYKIPLKVGSNIIVVEAIDVAGNINYSTKLVTVIEK